VIKVVDARIADVDIAEITAARPIPREERLAKAQRTPAKSAAKTYSEAKVNPNPEVRPAKPGHQRGSVKRPLPIRSRRPSPIRAEVNPAAVMEWSESPRSRVYPSPSPGRLPHPLPITVRSPSRPHVTRYPHVSIVRRIAPASVLVEIAGSNHPRGNVLRRYRFVFVLVAYLAPVVEAIAPRGVHGLMRQ
jgi:hypothetical protein